MASLIAFARPKFSSDQAVLSFGVCSTWIGTVKYFHAVIMCGSTFTLDHTMISKLGSFVIKRSHGFECIKQENIPVKKAWSPFPFEATRFVLHCRSSS